MSHMFYNGLATEMIRGNHTAGSVLHFRATQTHTLTLTLHTKHNADRQTRKTDGTDYEQKNSCAFSRSRRIRSLLCKTKKKVAYEREARRAFRGQALFLLKTGPANAGLQKGHYAITVGSRCTSAGHCR